MAKRERVDFSPEIEKLGVKADAGDSFIPGAPVTPERRDVGVGALRLAAGLAGLNQSLQGFVQKNIADANTLTRERKARFVRAEEQRGRAAAAKAGSEAGRAVMEGIIPPGASPYFIMGVKQQQGRILAVSHQDSLMTAMLTADPINANINQIIADHNSQFLEDNEMLNDSAINSGFRSVANGTENGVRQSFFAKKNAALRTVKLEGTAAEIANALDSHRAISIEAGRVPNYENFGLTVSQIIRQDRYLGMDGNASMKAAASAIVRHAVENNDKEVFKALDVSFTDPHNPDVTVLAPSSNPVIKAMIRAGEKEIDRHFEKDENKTIAARALKLREYSNAYVNVVVANVTANADWRPSKEFLALWGGPARQVANVALKAKSAIAGIQRFEPTDPIILGRARFLVNTGEWDNTDIYEAATSGVYHEEHGFIRINLEDYKVLAKDVARVKQNGSSLSDPIFTKGMQDIFSSLQPQMDSQNQPIDKHWGWQTVVRFRKMKGRVREYASQLWAEKVENNRNISDAEKIKLMGEIRLVTDAEFRPRIRIEFFKAKLESLITGLAKLPTSVLNDPTGDAAVQFMQEFIDSEFSTESQRQEFVKLWNKEKALRVINETESKRLAKVDSVAAIRRSVPQPDPAPFPIIGGTGASTLTR